MRPSWKSVELLASAQALRSLDRRTLRAMAFGPLKTKEIASKAASPHLAASEPNCPKPMCRQPLATEGSRERQFALSCPPQSPARNRPNPAHLSDILFSFHFEFSGSPATLENLRWHHAVRGLKPATRSAAWYRGALEREHYCRKHDLSTTSLMRWARHLLSAEDLHKRAQHQ